MQKYKLKYWFEHGGTCVWGANNEAKEQYGYNIENNLLPISELLVMELGLLEEEYGSYLDWSDPRNPSPWTAEHKRDFVKRATKAYEKLCAELGTDYTIENGVGSCV